MKRSDPIANTSIESILPELLFCTVIIVQDYQVKEQCRNCTFLNGQFAEECEMCGEALLNSLATTKAHKH